MIFLFSLSLVLLNFAQAKSSLIDQQIIVPAGKFQPFFKETNDKNEIYIEAFSINKYPVTNDEFNSFLKNNSKFSKSKILKIYADQRYLMDWKNDLLTTDELKKNGRKPVTNVSWFVAKKYCQSVGMRLPTIYEWEYASDSTNPEILKELLVWYSQTGEHEIVDVGSGKPNKFGIHDMHGVIWEWVEDFSSVMISSDSRSKGDRTDGFFCGGGSVSSLDSKAYATFMRYGFRSGLKGDYCMKSLGFRCVKDILKSGVK